MSIQLTKRDVRWVWKRALKEKGVKPVYSRAWTQRAKRQMAEFCLRAMHVDDIDGFLESRYILIGYRNRIYLLCPKRRPSTIQDLGVAAHELTHVSQMKSVGGWEKFYNEYFRRPGVRAHLEGQANGGEADVFRFTGHHVPTSSEIFTDRWRKVYKLNKTELASAVSAYDYCRRVAIGQNRIVTPGGAIVAKKIKERING